MCVFVPQTNAREQAKKLYLLDAYALIYRAYYALNRNPLINSKGLNTSAILGFANTLHELLTKVDPYYMAVVFDPPGHSFRSKIYPAYKANRAKTPEDIVLAIPYIKRLIEAFGVAQLMVEDYEADDVIGTLAKQAKQAGLDSVMMTPDKDFGQLVSPHIVMMKPANRDKEAEPFYYTLKLRAKIHFFYNSLRMKILKHLCACLFS